MTLLDDMFAHADRWGRQAVKRGVTALANRHRPGDANDLLILASPRSGSTWLMELIYKQPGVKYIDEPLAKHILDAEGIFPLETRWRYIDLDGPAKKALTGYLKNDRRVRRFGPRNVWAEEYDYTTDRRVLKLIRACALLPWFAEEGSFDVIYLMRHPIAQALSAMRRGHAHHLAAYVAARPPEAYSEAARARLDAVDATSADLETFAAAWCLENAGPLQYVASPPETNVFVLTYEELVLNPEVVLQKLAATLHLDRPDRMMQQVTTPSAVTDSTARRTKDRIRKGDRSYLVRKWKDQISKAQEDEVFSLLDAFGIDAYRPGRLVAAERFLHGEQRSA